MDRAIYQSVVDRRRRICKAKEKFNSASSIGWVVIEMQYRSNELQSKAEHMDLSPVPFYVFQDLLEEELAYFEITPGQVHNHLLHCKVLALAALMSCGEQFLRKALRR